MPIHETGDRLVRLRALLTRIQGEIKRLEDDRARYRNGRPQPPPPRKAPPKPPADRVVRAWARGQGIDVPPTGRISTTLRDAYLADHPRKKAGTTHD